MLWGQKVKRLVILSCIPLGYKAPLGSRTPLGVMFDFTLWLFARESRGLWKSSYHVRPDVSYTVCAWGGGGREMEVSLLQVDIISSGLVPQCHRWNFPLQHFSSRHLTWPTYSVTTASSSTTLTYWDDRIGWGPPPPPTKKDKPTFSCPKRRGNQRPVAQNEDKSMSGCPKKEDESTSCSFTIHKTLASDSHLNRVM